MLRAKPGWETVSLSCMKVHTTGNLENIHLYQNCEPEVGFRKIPTVE